MFCNQLRFSFFEGLCHENTPDAKADFACKIFFRGSWPRTSDLYGRYGLVTVQTNNLGFLIKEAKNRNEILNSAVFYDFESIGEVSQKKKYFLKVKNRGWR